MPLEITATASFKFGYKVAASDVKEFLDSIPEDAEITVDHYKGDQRDPAYTTLKATWKMRK